MRETGSTTARGSGMRRACPTTTSPWHRRQEDDDQQRSSSAGRATERRRPSEGQPSEDELRAAYEAELSRITSADMMLADGGVAVEPRSLRLGLRRAGAPPRRGGAGRDLAQARDAVDGVSALLGILERTPLQELRPLRDALSQLQMAYAREAQAPARAGRDGNSREHTASAGREQACQAGRGGEARRRAGGVERQAVGPGR